jgi:hypothetical protein
VALSSWSYWSETHEETLYHNTIFPTDKLVGKATFTNWKSVGNQFCRPTLLDTVSPVGNCLSRPTYVYRPIVWQHWTPFADRHIFSQPTLFYRPTFLSRPTIWQGTFYRPTSCRQAKILSHSLTLRILPADLQLANQLTFPTYSLHIFDSYIHFNPIILHQVNSQKY